jgi:hypothetical protein
MKYLWAEIAHKKAIARDTILVTNWTLVRPRAFEVEAVEPIMRPRSLQSRHRCLGHGEAQAIGLGA